MNEENTKRQSTSKAICQDSAPLGDRDRDEISSQLTTLSPSKLNEEGQVSEDTTMLPQNKFEGGKCSTEQEQSAKQLPSASSEGQRAAKEESNFKSAKDEDSHISMMELARRLPRTIRDKHKTLLFELVINSTKGRRPSSQKRKAVNNCLANLGHEKRARLLRVEPKKKSDVEPNRGRQDHGAKEPLFASKANESPLFLVPHALNSKISPSTRKTHNRISTRGGHTRKHEKRGIPSRSLQELESYVLARFSESKLDKKENTEAHASSEDTKRRHNPSDFRAIGLVYNECSMATLSEWSRRSITKDLEDSPEHTYSRPAPSSTFRCCSICNTFGHYEVECKELPRRHHSLITVEKELGVQRTLKRFFNQYGYFEDDQNPQQHQQSSDSAYSVCEICSTGYVDETMLVCDGCDRLFHLTCLEEPLFEVPEGDWFCSACEGYNSDISSTCEVETFGQFVIEQQKADDPSRDERKSQTHGIEVKDDGFASAIGIGEKHLTSHHAIPSGTMTDSDDSKGIVLAEGEFCWAKREHAADGKLAKTDWWPASVLTEVKELKHKKLDPDSKHPFTPYLVRMFGLPGASRTRATAVLPFFRHFEELGYERIKRFPKEKRDDHLTFESTLCHGVLEAIKQLGFSSLAQALKRAREISQKERRLVVKKAPCGWEEAERTEVDGFLVLAKPNHNNVMTKAANGTAVVGSKNKRQRQLIGCVVSWILKAKIMVGIVHALDLSQKKALVRSIQDWEKLLVQRKDEVVELSDLFQVNMFHLSGARWLDASILQIVCPAPAHAESKLFRGVILPDRLQATRQRYIDQMKQAEESEVEEMKIPSLSAVIIGSDKETSAIPSADINRGNNTSFQSESGEPYVDETMKSKTVIS